MAIEITVGNRLMAGIPNPGLETPPAREASIPRRGSSPDLASEDVQVISALGNF